MGSRKSENTWAQWSPFAFSKGFIRRGFGVLIFTIFTEELGSEFYLPVVQSRGLSYTD